MIELNLPKYNFKIKETLTKLQIYDDIRKKYLVLTPEEWVRQNFVKYMVNELNYPKGLMAIEKGLKVNKLQRRTDVVVYNKAMNPMLIVECKATDVKITQETFNQIANYNIALKVPYLVVTNGLNHYISKIDFKDKSYLFIDEIPKFEQL